MSASAEVDHSPLRAWGPAIFVVAIFLSAFLIFLVQPMVGKRILPWFGGAPSVWSVCLAFYQTTLFVGYGYAHLLIRYVPPSLQGVIHAVVIVLAVLARPILPEAAWAEGDLSQPTATILAMMSAHVALPFMALASTGPLVQSWFATRHPDRSPYPLYAVSNLGSLLALFAYPILFEPRLGLAETGRYWSVAFAVAMLAALATAELARRAQDPMRSEGSSPPSGVSGVEQQPQVVTPGLVALWLLLAGAAVVMLNGVTNRLCLDVASVPFLWILPLATYLATFILCFSSDGAYRRSWAFGLVFLTLLLSALRASGVFVAEGEEQRGLVESFGSLPMAIAYYCLLLFGVCSVLHGELYRLRPAARSLTSFYLCVSGGGAVGGIFVGIVAPVVFVGYTEFGVGLGLGLALALFVVAREQGGIVAAWGAQSWLARVGLVLAVALGAHAILQTQVTRDGQLSQERNFFGVLRVIENGEGEGHQLLLMHGSTLHGLQFTSPRGRGIPTAYFGRGSSLASLFATLPQGRGARIGTIGLGAGTIASYARPGDFVRFYEIDPAVVRVARDDAVFSFLSESKGQVEVRVGDARLELERERERGERHDFDVFIVDAFSSDAIPIHLMTTEAFEIYASTLAEGGVLAVHVSNRHFNLMPLVARLGQEVGLEHLQAVTMGAPSVQTQASWWVYLARDPQRLSRVVGMSRALLSAYQLPETTQVFRRLSEQELVGVPLFTDDYSDLFGVLNVEGERAR